MEYEILEYSSDNLLIALNNKKISSENLENKHHLEYFENYLGAKGIGAQSILIEKKYISKAYLIDYSNYYSTCFQNYKRICKRIHFFKERITEERFEKELFDNNSNYLNENYLGYIVLKPLPESIIGPTLLKTYPSDHEKGTRYYPACRNYDVNLFGKKLSLETLAFQEQDYTVAACASVAIWSAFHKTSKLFDTHLPSPSEITKSAGNTYLNNGRTFPTPGLDIFQICEAIAALGIDPELEISWQFRKDSQLAKRLIYAYSKAGLPVLLFFNFANSIPQEKDRSVEDEKSDDGVEDDKLSKQSTEKSSDRTDEEQQDTTDYDLDIDDENGHLITIVGYSDENRELEKTDEISLFADRIKKFYAHDDQVGPFARMEFDGNENITTSWEDGDTSTKGAIYSVIIPIYKKVRIKFIDVFTTISSIDQILFQANIFTGELEWDIFLQDSNTYKSTVCNSEFENDIKRKVQFSSYPKYIWIGSATIAGEKLFDFIFDSTDIASGYYCIDFVLFFTKDGFPERLKKHFELFENIYCEELNGPRLGEKLYNKIIQNFE